MLKGFRLCGLYSFKEALVVTISRHPCCHGLTRELFLRRTHKAGPPGHELRRMLGGHETRPLGSARGPLALTRIWKPPRPASLSLRLSAAATVAVASLANSA
jgi:hypothetical protein